MNGKKNFDDSSPLFATPCKKYDESGKQHKTFCRNLSIVMFQWFEELFTKVNPLEQTIINYDGLNLIVEALDEFSDEFSPGVKPA